MNSPLPSAPQLHNSNIFQGNEGGSCDGMYVAGQLSVLSLFRNIRRPVVGDSIMDKINMLPIRKIALLVGFSLLASLVMVSAVDAGAPTEEIQSAVEKVTTILKDPKLQSEAKRRELREVVYSKFDFAEMAKRSLGSHWQRRSREEQQEFVKLFTDLIENAYMSTLESYQGEKVVIGNEKRDKDFAEVNTKIVTKKGEDFSVNYKLRQAGQDWKIYDVVIENISLVNNYRSQFTRVIAQSSFDDLFRKMKDRQFDAVGKKRT
jgi:ABC-type transport system involved in resistance to organic solvents, auxiliary component